MGPLKLDDDEFWGEDFRRTTPEVKAELLTRDPAKALLIDAPETVPVDRRSSFPLLGYHMRSARDDRSVSLGRSGIVAALDLSTNALHVDMLLDRGKTRAPDPEERPPAPAWLTHINMFQADLRETLKLPWQPGRYRVAVLLRELLSNQVEVELARESGFDDPAVQAFLESERGRAATSPQPVHPPHPAQGDERSEAERFPRYQGSEAAPPVPEAPGIVLQGERVQQLGASSCCMIRGSFRLPLLPRELVRPDPVTGAPPKVGDPAAQAVVPITVLATGSVTHGPFVFSLQIPAYDVEHGEQGMPPQAAGQFELDLFQLTPPLPVRPQTYFLTAFNGRFAQGPLPMAFVSADMLRQS